MVDLSRLIHSNNLSLLDLIWFTIVSSSPSIVSRLLFGRSKDHYMTIVRCVRPDSIGQDNSKYSKIKDPVETKERTKSQVDQDFKTTQSSSDC